VSSAQDAGQSKIAENPVAAEFKEAQFRSISKLRPFFG